MEDIVGWWFGAEDGRPVNQEFRPQTPSIVSATHGIGYVTSRDHIASGEPWANSPRLSRSKARGVEHGPGHR